MYRYFACQDFSTMTRWSLTKVSPVALTKFDLDQQEAFATPSRSGFPPIGLLAIISFCQSFSFPTHPYPIFLLLCSVRLSVLRSHIWIYFCATHNWIYFCVSDAPLCPVRIIGVVEANTMVWVPLSSY
jgi:hypothetical protein